METERLAHAAAPNRLDLWCDFLNQTRPRRVLEIGVWRGDFAAALLARCPSIEAYYMIDPWRALSDWNKPLNQSDSVMEDAYQQAMARTDFARDKRIVLRGTTIQTSDEIEDESLDFIYVDGDHTLRGITIDLVRAYPKLRPGGILAGDDFSSSIWHHPSQFEPTLVAPFAIHFAEAHDHPIVACPFDQFAIEKIPGHVFLSGEGYANELRTQIRPPAASLAARAKTAIRKVRRAI